LLYSKSRDLKTSRPRRDLKLSGPRLAKMGIETETKSRDSIPGLTMLLNTKSLLIATKQLVFFFAQKSINSLLHQMFFWMLYVYNLLANGMWMNTSRKDDNVIQRQVKSLYCAANKLRGTSYQCSPALKNTLFRAYCMPMYLTGSHAMRRIYLKAIGGRPRPDWYLLSNRVGGHDINRSNRINKTKGYKRI